MQPMDRPNIIRYWQSIELLQPQSIPKVQRREQLYQPYIHNLEGSHPLPWEPSSSLAHEVLPEKYRWSHLLYARLFDFGLIVRGLEAEFGADTGYKDDGVSGVALFAIRFNQTGEMIEDSLTLSSAAWMYGRLVKKSQWASGLDKDMDRAREQAAQMLPGVATREQLDNLITWIIDFLGLSDVLSSIKPLHRFVSTPLKRDDDPTDDPLNSFILDDLNAVSDAVRRGSISKPLSAYLGIHSEKNRIDISSKASVQWLINSLLPGKYPLGCWPTENNIGLVHSQQLAVNNIIATLTDAEGLLSVNGPPGTGKTTLLRDIVAAVVTNRASVLAKLRRASDAFPGGKIEEVAINDRGFFAYLLDDSLFGHEIVVASSNNGAVENVTLELPQRGKVDKSWLTEYDHFSNISEIVNQEEAWGLVSAALGNKTNRGQFISRFWLNRESVDQLRKKLGRHSGNTAEQVGFTPLNFKDYLDMWADEELGSEERRSIWAEAVERFDHAVRLESSMREQAASIEHSLPQLIKASKSVSSTRASLNALCAARDASQNELDHVHETDWTPLRRAVAGHTNDLELHEKAKPRFLHNLFTLWNADRHWKATHHRIQQKARHATQELSLVASKVRHLEHKIAGLNAQVVSAQEAVELAISQYRAEHHACLKLADRFGAIHFKNWLFSRDIAGNEEIELAEPWVLPGWREARARVFMEALELHKVFYRLESKRVRANLSIAMKILKGNVLRNVSRSATRSVWATLFMVVPVLSSTFASFARTFKSLGHSDIGWLLVDEAGQATPQAAVGALWRSRRSVLVGDPLQLKPVITVPESVMEHMRRAFDVDSAWKPNCLSAQRLADLANPVGRMLGPPDAKQWVGLPLTVHRRCDRPMFELANRIAYDHAMVYGTTAPPPDKETPATLPSGWIHVLGSSPNNWVPAEGQALMSLLALLRNDGVQDKDISVITPFAAVRNQLRRLLRPPMVFGTIHTMQGKESAVVIMVLGGRTDAPGARDWAVSEPNLLNVAATRAKRRLYVIGDRNDWGNRHLFAQVMDLLPILKLPVTALEEWQG